MLTREYLKYNGKLVGVLIIPYDGLCATLQINESGLDRIKLKRIIKKAFKRLDKANYEGQLHLIQPYAIICRDDWITKNLLIGTNAMRDLGHKLLMKVHNKIEDLWIKTDIQMVRR